MHVEVKLLLSSSRPILPIKDIRGWQDSVKDLTFSSDHPSKSLWTSEQLTFQVERCSTSDPSNDAQPLQARLKSNLPHLQDKSQRVRGVIFTAFKAYPVKF
eukprot:5256682-Amphidinium_carterae.1